ncbi:MAG: hypothetical protein IAG13_28645 [Deltaproteobacteria bacterium]|nr:hypothetical protein [Nannocystaceae bacterium]
MPTTEHPRRSATAIPTRTLQSIAATATLSLALPSLAAPRDEIVPTAVGDDDLRRDERGSDDDDDREEDDGDDDRDPNHEDDVNDDNDDDDKDIDGAEDSHLRVHVDSEALGGAWIRTDGTDETPSDSSLQFGAGLARPSLLDSNAAVFSRPMFGFGLGYVFAEDRAIVGAKLSVSVDGYNIDSDSRTLAVGGRLVPYFQWMFMPDRWIRPYVEARVGFGGSADVADDDDTGRTTGHVIYPLVGAGGGVHMFPRDWFSVDLGLNVDYAAPFGRTTFRNDDLDDTDWEKAADVVNFGILLGMSTWF